MSPETWRWIWLGAAVVFATGEIAMAGAFFLLPFAIAAAASAVLAFLDIGVAWEWAAFVVIGAVALPVMRSLSRRLDRPAVGEGFGVGRLVGQSALVVHDVPAPPAVGGIVRVGGEEWRAESSDGEAIPAGTVVKIVEVRGTRVVVWPLGTVAPPPERSQG